MHIEEKHDPSADEVVAIERRLYKYNCQATGFSDDKDLGFVARDKVGNIIGGSTWLLLGRNIRAEIAVGRRTNPQAWVGQRIAGQVY